MEENITYDDDDDEYMTGTNFQGQHDCTPSSSIALFAGDKVFVSDEEFESTTKQLAEAGKKS